MHPLDLDQLRTLVAIADSGSFTRAAEAVNKTQSAVSMQMKRLEERVGREVFCRAGRVTRLTDDGERLLDYARRIVRLHAECLAAFDEGDLAGRVRLGLPDDYASATCRRSSAASPAPIPGRGHGGVRAERRARRPHRRGDLDLAIVTEAEQAGAVETVRGEALLWVGSNRHRIHTEATVPLALGRPNCRWRMRALASLEQAGRPNRILFVSWSSTAVGAVVLAGLAVSVLPESALKPGMRLLGPADGFPALTGCRIGLMRHRGRDPNPTADALAMQIRQSLDNLRGRGGVARSGLQGARHLGRQLGVELGRGIAVGGHAERRRHEDESDDEGVLDRGGSRTVGEEPAQPVRCRSVQGMCGPPSGEPL